MTDLETKCVNTIRVFAADVVEKANSGHPGAPMGCAPMAHVLFSKVMKYNPLDPSWANRDRFVLSNGHGCALLYTMLHLTGYEKPTMDDLKEFRQLNSVTAGHPENFLLEGVEVSTGPLGQGISNAVGLAIAEKHLAATYNKPGFNVVDNYTFVICGDGCLQEGVSSEASSLAGHLELGKLIVLYDDNRITIDGSTSLSFTEDVAKRYESYGWQVLTVESGNTDIEAIEEAVKLAKHSHKPTMIKITTEIGYGSDKAGTHGVHGAPLGAASLKKVKAHFGFDPEAKFAIAEDVLSYYREAVDRGESAQSKWTELFAAYKEAHPQLAEELERRMSGNLPHGWQDVLPKWTPKDKPIASRNSSQTVLNALANVIPELIGGSADLTPSNKTDLKCTHDFQPKTPDGRYFRFGVREHGMTAICNGMAAYGGIIPYGATFLNFAGYALGAIRLSALSKFQVLQVHTHDSIGLGEDGPTHQPVEMLVSLRTIPNMYVFRPADANEVSGSYKAALEMRNSPSLLALSRQDLPNLPGSDINKVGKGGYIIETVGAKPQLIIVSTGSEVEMCITAAKELVKNGLTGVLVVSMPCNRLFDEQPLEYKKSVFPKGVPVLSVEAAAKTGWERYSHMQMGLETFGKSAPAEKVYEYFGLTAANIANNGKKLVNYFGKTTAPWLVDLPRADDGHH